VESVFHFFFSWQNLTIGSFSCQSHYFKVFLELSKNVNSLSSSIGQFALEQTTFASTTHVKDLPISRVQMKSWARKALETVKRRLIGALDS
jgi:hypothetical protein